MDIDIWYDPIMPGTTVYLDGQKLDNRDIYGFLYPVRSYPLQAWLNADGSWSGLVKQLYDLARGENLQLIFHGRRIDYEDIKTVLAGNENVECKYSLWDSAQMLHEKEMKMEEAVSKLKLESAPDLTLMQMAEIKLSKEAPWLTRIDTEESFREAANSPSGCYYVTEQFLEGYPQIERLSLLNKGMRIPRDAICCVFETDIKRRAFEQYAAMFPQLQFRFSLAAASQWKSELMEKYGVPYIEKCHHIEKWEQYQILKSAVLSCVNRTEELDKEYGELVLKRQNFGELDEEDQKRYTVLQRQRKWAQAIRKSEEFLRFCQLLDEENIC